jgi:spermidine synthase
MQHMEILERFVAQRARERNLSITFDKLAYVQSHIISELSSHGERVLYVGVGHGHDAVYCLLKGAVKKAVGVDPYLTNPGNPQDRINLNQLLEQTGLQDRFQVVVGTIEKYIEHSEQSFSAIVMFDVLHHIFEVRGRLSHCGRAGQAAQLAQRLSDHLEPGGVIIVQETEPWGLRQAITRMGLLSSQVVYKTKQHWRQWADMLTGPGLRLKAKMVYLPWRLRGLRGFLNNSLGLYTASDRLIMIFEK